VIFKLTKEDFEQVLKYYPEYRQDKITNWGRVREVAMARDPFARHNSELNMRAPGSTVNMQRGSLANAGSMSNMTADIAAASGSNVLSSVTGMARYNSHEFSIREEVHGDDAVGEERPGVKEELTDAMPRWLTQSSMEGDTADLDSWGMGETCLPPGLFARKGLRRLRLSRNHLTQLPPGVLGNLSNLQKLVLSNNQLMKLPLDLGWCKQMKELDVSCNFLTELPHSVCELSELNSFKAFKNELNSLPARIGALVRLEELNCLTTNCSCCRIVWESFVSSPHSMWPAIISLSCLHLLGW